MALRNAFGNLSTEAKQDTQITAIGAIADAEATGNGSLIALLKRLRTLLAGGLPAALGGAGGVKVEQQGSVAVTGPLTDTQLRASAPAVRDDYSGGEVLAQQAGANGVLTFTFSSAVNLVVAESTGDGLVARADPFGGTPAITTGIPLRHEVPTFMPVVTSALKVYAPTGTTINAAGYRR